MSGKVLPAPPSRQTHSRRQICMDPISLKIEAARTALEPVESGMRLGIGTGSTAEELVRLLAEKCRAGFDVIGVPTSERTAALCEQLGVRLTTLEETPELDLTIDGADEIDGDLTLIKGGGGGAVARKDRRGGLGENDRDRRSIQAGAEAWAISASHRGEPVRPPRHGSGRRQNG